MSLPELVAIPASLAPLAERPGAALRAVLAERGRADDWPAARWEAFARAGVASDFVAEQALGDVAAFLELAASGQLERPLRPGELRAQLQALLADCAQEDELARQLRRFRNRQQLRIVWRDVNRQADLGETCRDLSDLADACVDQACQWLHVRLCAQLGTPMGNRSGAPQQLVMLGMGKLGGHELKLSSDIDLIFGYEEGGETEGVKRSLDNQDLFTRLGQRLFKALDAISVDGFVFRTDMRLRPYGSSGPLVYSFNALEPYYQDQGRDWERYAMIKARVVGGDMQAG